MPFERSQPVGCEPRARFSLLVASLLITLSLLAAGLALRLSPAATEGGLVSEMMENESVVAFLGLEE